MKQTIFYTLLFLIVSCQAPDPPSELGNAPTPEFREEDRHKAYIIGQVIDSLNGVKVYYNSNDIRNTVGRNKANDGYNYGLKWQCVEFVKRYYYDELDHRMPNTWGHAKEFFNLHLSNGAFNNDRGLYQWRNGSATKPRINDIVVFGGYTFGHVAIISEVTDQDIEIVQQNVGAATRQRLVLTNRNGRWYIRHGKILGWLSSTR